ncbi:MAG TPA: hypothetical protein VLB00_15215 [Gemmatimonadales bacterium]|nr:hypothetical protein [Gemmatimonadales bacterium]
MRISDCFTSCGLGLALVAAACGSDNVLAPAYQPEVVNTPNVVFSFQATGLQDVTDAVTYTWNVSSGHVIIHPATATTSGTIVLNVKDAGGAVIYNGTVPASGDITPPAGAAGAWKITVTLQNYSGTINFAVQMQ